MKFPSKKLAKKYKKFKKINQYTVAVTNSGCPSTSLVGKKIAEDCKKCDFVFLWHYLVNKNLYIVSLRSKKVDVGTIAKIMGGGGHKLASGFAFSSKDFSINDIFN